MNCSHCVVGTLTRAKSHGVARILSIFGIRPFRCDTCCTHSFRVFVERGPSTRSPSWI
jgi:hypothetical protein